MKYYVGIDGGGSNTKSLVCSQDKIICGEFFSGSSNISSNGIKNTMLELNKNFELIMESLNFKAENCKGITLGLAGINQEEQKEQIKKNVSKIFRNAIIKVFDDAYVALVGAHGCESGGILISGTGSIARAFTRDRELVRVGGYGHLLDDIGSGYDIGRQVLSSVLMSWDGRIGETILKELIIETGLNSPDEILKMVYNKEFQKKDIAKYCIYAFKAAKRNDPIANRIIESAIDGLAELVNAIVMKTKINDLKIALSGSVLEQAEGFSKRLIQKCKKQIPNVIFVEKQNNAAYGALLLATGYSEIKVR